MIPCRISKDKTDLVVLGDIRAAQESSAGSLDNRFRIERSLDAYTRAETLTQV